MVARRLHSDDSIDYDQSYLSFQRCLLLNLNTEDEVPFTQSIESMDSVELCLTQFQTKKNIQVPFADTRQIQSIDDVTGISGKYESGG
jgi:hypothetical protein